MSKNSIIIAKKLLLSKYWCIFAQSKNCGARKTAVASERLWNNIRSWPTAQLTRSRGNKRRENARCYGSRFLIKGVMQPVPGWRKHSHVEAGSNTSTVALWVVGGDERESNAWGYNWATQFLGDINTRFWPSKSGKSRIWDSKTWTWVPLDSDPRMTALTRASSNCKRHTHALVREDVT
jgi:hypothetical protein